MSASFANLHLLMVLAETQSFTQAARRLGISKASVSSRIAELERETGVPLVRRTTRSVVLTQAGVQLVEDNQAAFAHIEQSFARVRDMAEVPRGLIRVTAPVALGRQHLAVLLPEFLHRHPEIQIELDLNDSLLNLAREGFDLAVRHAHTAPDTYVAWELTPTRSLLCASPDYLAQAGTPQHPSELARHRCLPYLRSGVEPAWSFEHALSQTHAERVSVRVTGPLKVNNSEVLRQAVLGGLGIGLLPDFTAMQALRSGQIEAVLPDWKPLGFFGDRLFAIRPWSSHVPMAVQRFVSHLKTSFSGGFT